MRKRVATVVLAAAMAGLFGLSAPALAQSARDNAAAEQPDAAKDHTQIPVKEVVLYSSGVGYFEHFGTVKGNGTTELFFKTAQINDILKSLVLQDMDKGKIGVITYPSQDPIAKTLRSFQIDITSNPSMADLLNQLRGAKVTIQAGAEKVTGTVLGVEKKQRPVGSGDGARVIDVPYLNIIADGGQIRSISLEEVRDLHLEDPKLREELQRALAALASARDQDKKPVKISLMGEGERRVRIGYVVETPVWKTSYRLILSDKGGAKQDEKAGVSKLDDATTDKNVPAEAKDAGAGKGAAVAGKGESASLQGWAIVENQTDNDWNDVQLSLVSGRPISFIQDLYQPLYVPRPVVQPELYASLRPQTYDEGIAGRRPMEQFNAPAAAAMPAAPAPMQSFARKRGANGAMGGQMANDAVVNQEEKSRSLIERDGIDAAASISSIASAAKVGELFQYTVGSVTLPRQTSAMIPVVTDPIEVEKVSIYNMNVLAKNPLLGARVKNTTGKHLLQGPITVLDDGSYAGDARIDDLPPGQERLVSYGVDQQIIVQAQNDHQENTVMTGKIVKGVLELTRKLVASQEYVAENKGDHDKTLIIEQNRRGGDWKLVEPAKADETTDSLYRFKGKVAAGKGTKLTVREELINLQRIALMNLDDGSLDVYVRTGEIPKDVRDALVKAAKLRQDIAGTQRQITDRQQKIAAITQEQTRLRDNMKTVPQNTDYYTRLLKKLDEQESQIEAFQKEITDLQKTQETQRKALADYLNGLSVG